MLGFTGGVAEIVGPLLSAISRSLPFIMARFKKGVMKYKFVYVKIVHLRRRGRSSPVYRAQVRRTGVDVDVFDEYHYIRLNVFHRPHRDFRCLDQTSGVVDLQVIHPWQSHLAFAYAGAAELSNTVEQVLEGPSDVFLTKSVYYNAMQDGHEDVSMKFEHDVEEARLFVDFSSLPKADRILISDPKAVLRDLKERETLIGVSEPAPGVFSAEVKKQGRARLSDSIFGSVGGKPMSLDTAPS